MGETLGESVEAGCSTSFFFSDSRETDPLYFRRAVNIGPNPDSLSVEPFREFIREIAGEAGPDLDRDLDRLVLCERRIRDRPRTSVTVIVVSVTVLTSMVCDDTYVVVTTLFPAFFLVFFHIWMCSPDSVVRPPFWRSSHFFLNPGFIMLSLIRWRVLGSRIGSKSGDDMTENR